MCEREREKKRERESQIDDDDIIYIYIYIYMCVCVCVCVYVPGIMVIVVRNGHRYPSSDPGRSCISHGASTLEKSMKPTIVPPVIGK